MMTWAELHDLLGGRITNRIEPKVVTNIAPATSILVALPDGDGYMLATMEWGVRADWARALLINAQAEKYTAPGRSFWAQFRRCLIPASGFYEWKAVPGGPKQPMFIANTDRSAFMFAGLCGAGRGPDRTSAEQCVIVTTQPNSLVAQIHNRMPAILLPENYGRWLDPDAPNTAMGAVLTPYPADRLRMYPVSRRVNNVKNQGPDLVEPVSDAVPGVRIPPRESL